MSQIGKFWTVRWWMIEELEEGGSKHTERERGRSDVREVPRFGILAEVL